MNANDDSLKRLFNALPEASRLGEDESRYYVGRAENATKDIVVNVRRHIAWAPAGSAYLFSGLRGTGKTTELRRLIADLNADGVSAFYCDASEYLNLHNPQLTRPDLLMAALCGLADAVRAKHGKDFLKESMWDRAKRFVKSDLKLKPTAKAELPGFGSVELEASLQENPVFKQQLNEFAQTSGEFYEEARKFAADVAATVRGADSGRKVVLVVDSLERLSAAMGDESKLFDSLKDIFFNNPAQLQFPGISVIYSVPPYLDAVLPNVGAGFTKSFSLPNFKVMERPTAATPVPAQHQPGLELMREIVAHRFPEWDKVLTPEAVKHMAWLSGGNVRRFFSLLRASALLASLGSDPLPLAADAAALQQAVNEETGPLQWLNKNDRVWLERYKNGEVNPAKDIENLLADLPSIMRLFDHSLVLNYQNGTVWYNVPPLVRDHV